METGIRILLLSAALALGGCASIHHLFHRHADRDAAQTSDAAQAADEGSDAHPPRVIEPEVERRKIKVPKIHSSNVEFGVYQGALSIEDFGTHPVSGLSAAYHVTEDFFFLAEVGRAKGGRTSYETLGGQVQLLTDAERYLTYYNVALGYNFLPGEVYLGRGRAMTSAFYILGGIGSTKFGGDQRFTASFGAGYRVLPTNWLALHVGVEDRLFESDLLGVDKRTANLEAQIGATVFF